MVAPFHGDLRFSVLKINDLSDAIAVLLHLSDFTAMQALRPLSISAALDLVLAHPQWQDHLDATRIGGLGASKGDETMMLRRRRPGNPAAQRQLSTMASVAGGGDDSVVIYYNGAP